MFSFDFLNDSLLCAWICGKMGAQFHFFLSHCVHFRENQVNVTLHCFHCIWIELQNFSFFRTFNKRRRTEKIGLMSFTKWLPFLCTFKIIRNIDYWIRTHNSYFFSHTHTKKTTFVVIAIDVCDYAGSFFAHQKTFSLFVTFYSWNNWWIFFLFSRCFVVVEFYWNFISTWEREREREKRVSMKD